MSLKLKVLVIFITGVFLTGMFFLATRTISNLTGYGAISLEDKEDDKTQEGNFDEFAKCLTSNGVRIYCIDSSSDCARQQAYFGGSFKFINYTNCDENRRECISGRISRYPTWAFSSGKLVGVQSLTKLKQITRC